MPTTVYDSSLITKRNAAKATSGSFINRITNPVNPQTGSAPLLGISQQSIINAVRTGNMPFYRKTDGGCTTVDNGCPCLPMKPLARPGSNSPYNGWFRVTTKSLVFAPYTSDTTSAGYTQVSYDISWQLCKYVNFDSVSQYPKVIARFYPVLYDYGFVSLYRQLVFESCQLDSSVILWEGAPYTESFTPEAALDFYNSLIGGSFAYPPSNFKYQSGNHNRIVANLSFLPTDTAINSTMAIMDRIEAPPSLIPYNSLPQSTPISTPLEMWNYYSNQLLENYGLYNPKGTTSPADDSYFQTVAIQQVIKANYEAGVTYTYNIDHIVASTVGQSYDPDLEAGICSPSGLTRIHLTTNHYITEGSTITISGLTNDWAPLNGTHTNLIPYSFAYNPIDDPTNSKHIDQGSLPKYAYGFCLRYNSSGFSQQDNGCQKGWATGWNEDNVAKVTVTHHVTDTMTYAEWVGAMLAYHREAFGTTEHGYFTYLFKDDGSGVPLDDWTDSQTELLVWFTGKQQFMPTVGYVLGVNAFYNNFINLNTTWIPADHNDIRATLTNIAILPNYEYGITVADNYLESVNQLWYRFGGSYTEAIDDETAYIRQQQIYVNTVYGIGDDISGFSTVEFGHNTKGAGEPTTLGDGPWYAFGTSPLDDPDIALNFFNFGIIKEELTTNLPGGNPNRTVGYISVPFSLPWIEYPDNTAQYMWLRQCFFPKDKTYADQLAQPNKYTGLWAQPIGYIMRWFASVGCTDIIVNNSVNIGGLSEWIAQHFGEDRYATNMTNIFENVPGQDSNPQQIADLETYGTTISPLSKLECTYIDNTYGPGSVWNTGRMVLLQSESDYSAGNVIRFLCIGDAQDGVISSTMELKVLGSFKGYFGGASLGNSFIPNNTSLSLDNTVLYSSVSGEAPAQNEYNIKQEISGTSLTPLNNIRDTTEVSDNSYDVLKGAVTPNNKAWICSLEDLVYPDFGFCPNTRPQISGDTRAAPDTTDFTTWRYAYLEGAISEITTGTWP